MTSDQTIGAVLRNFRGGMSQHDLAKAMRDAGEPKFSQATIWAIECGERPLRLREAETLANILRVRVSDFLDEGSADLALAMADYRRGIDDAEAALRRIHAATAPEQELEA